MAKNTRRVSGEGFVRYTLDVGASGSSGDVTLIGAMPVYLLEDTNASDEATCEIIGCMRVVNATAAGADGSGNSAIAVGDALYDDSGTINKDDANGVKIGYALGTVSSGGTGAIDIALTG